MTSMVRALQEAGDEVQNRTSAREREKALAWIAIAVWAACLGLGIHAVLSGSPLPPIFVAADPRGGPPILTGFRSGWNPEPSGLQVGDRLLRLGEEDLTGVGPIGLFAKTAKAGRGGKETDLAYRRDGATANTRLRLPSTPSIWRVAPISLAWATLAIVILSRSSWSQASRYAFGASIGIALTAPLFGGSYAKTILSAAALSFGAGAMAVFGVFFCMSFLSSPQVDGSAPQKRRWPWLFAVAAPLEASRDFGLLLPPAIGNICFIATVSLSALCALWQLTRRARCASPIERRQLYWVLFGLYWGAAPIILATLLTLADDRFAPLYGGAVVIAGVLPVVWAFAIFRLNMFDVDQVISVTTTYSIVAVVLLVVGWYVDSLFLENQSILVKLFISASLFALWVPGVRWLRLRVERLLFAEQMRYRRGIELVAESFSDCRDTGELWEQVVLGLHRAVDPLSCAIYSIDATNLEPVAHRGPAASTALPREGGLIDALFDRSRSFHVQPRRDIALTFEERTALQSLQAAVIVPIRHRDRLHAFIVLGEKHSEDIYTRRDLAAFDSVARAISTHLACLDDLPLVDLAMETADQRG